MNFIRPTCGSARSTAPAPDAAQRRVRRVSP